MNYVVLRLLLCLILAVPVFAQARRPRPTPTPYDAPEPPALDPHSSSLESIVDRYSIDARSLQQFYDLPVSPTTDRTLRRFYTSWLAALDRVDFDELNQDSRVDYLLFRNELSRQIHELDLEKQRSQEIAELIPFAETILSLQEARQRVEPLDAARAASTLAKMDAGLQELMKKKPEEFQVKKTVANRASCAVSSLRTVLRRWYELYDGYDPVFRWWLAEPHKQVDGSLDKYSAFLRERLAGVSRTDKDTILGDPIGRQALLDELRYEMVRYTPDQLVELANKEFAWCDREMLKASRELGFGDDWKKALEHVKTLHVPPGEQPALIRDLAVEAIEFVEKHNLVSVPPLARDVWRMEMMTPERQRVNPFFTGGEAITVSFPTDSMSHEQKLMSMRGNNIHFSHATVFHEVIPGHNLQRFMNLRYRPYRRVFSTPFWGEGWALYWEMLLWDLGFHKSPEDRIGALFWRMHRCARIIFSLSFHLEKMTAAESVDFLVNRVGHERENAAAEVRRSFETSYAPLYQAAYMLGGLQFRALHRELVGPGKMNSRDFHDTILKLHSMPVEMVRATLINQRLTKDFSPIWKFYGDLP